MQYLKIQAVESNVNLEFYIEINDSRVEFRKVELAKGGLLGYASKDIQFHGTTLDKKPLLSLEELAKKHKVTELTKEEFELIWNRALITK